MSLSPDPIRKILKDDYICGWRNINGIETFAGRSHSHPVESTAVHTTNGAGGRNVQMVIVSPNREVLHVLPGYWSPDALRCELQFGLELATLAAQEAPAADKNDAFLLAHMNHAAKHEEIMARDSKLQGFDKSKEERAKESDFRRRGGEGEVARTVDQVMHERMARRPFLKIEEFDLAAVVDYGTMFYDKHGDGCCDRKNGEEGLKKEPIPKGGGDPGPWRRTENGKR